MSPRPGRSRFSRQLAEAVLAEVIAACDPAARVRAALAGRPLAGRRLGVAIGKAALAMARGAGEVADGVAVVPRGGAGELPRGWRVFEGRHPVPDASSVAAGRAAAELVARAAPGDVVLALISGGASALAELPRGSLDELVATVSQVMAAGAPIDEINTVRGALSAIKAGQLAAACAAPLITLAVSDVIGDPLAVIGSGPTVGPWLASPGAAVDEGGEARRLAARAILGRLGVAVPAVLDEPRPVRLVQRNDYAEVIAPMASAAGAAVAALTARGLAGERIEQPMVGDVAAVADWLIAALGMTNGLVSPEAAAAERATSAAVVPGAATVLGTTSGLVTSAPTADDRSANAAVFTETPRLIVAWGEPTLRVPSDHGAGGRAQQLALELAKRLRGSSLGALVVGTDGVDGPPPANRPAPAGAWVDGATWDAIAAAGIDPAAALARCDAGSALAAVGALVVTGATGINHADLVILG